MNWDRHAASWVRPIEESVRSLLGLRVQWVSLPESTRFDDKPDMLLWALPSLGSLGVGIPLWRWDPSSSGETECTLETHV